MNEIGGVERSSYESPSFVEAGAFDLKPAFAVQFRVAKTLTALIEPAKFTPDHFRDVLRPLSSAQVLSAHAAENAQDPLVRDATARLVNMVALIGVGGDPQKAERLLGHEEYYDGSPEFVKAVQDLMNK